MSEATEQTELTSDATPAEPLLPSFVEVQAKLVIAIPAGDRLSTRIEIVEFRIDRLDKESFAQAFEGCLKRIEGSK